MSKPEIRFGTDGWRAIMCEAFTAENVRRVVWAIARHLEASGLSGKPVVIGYDGRFFGDGFARHAASVLAAAGIRVLMPERDLPTPVIAFAVVHSGAAGALMFTASHNPPEYNGVKFIPSFGGPAPAEVTAAIERALAEQGDREPPALGFAAARTGGFVEPIDPAPAYVEHLRTLINFDAIRRARLRVVYDAMHGAARGLMAAILREAGVEVIALRQTRDALFGGHPPEPLPAHLVELQRAMAERGAHLGLATDGDADRFGVVDEGGRFITPNELIALLAEHLSRRGGTGALVRTVATTHMLDRIAAAHGAKAYETPVGFKHICAIMRREPVLIGGEESGGLSIGGHIPEKDGLLADLLAVEARAVRGESLGRQLAELARKVGPSVSRRIDLDVSEEQKRALMARLESAPPERLGGLEVTGIERKDGVKLLLAGDA
ncbi:MAG TPA: phosphoglucomutase/phosphomannomutase family protein, partial [Limnochordia bacterium]|nr:phosphoglucomutase/phosphomannomutase family protein [Limnochordia bacterium]